MDVNAKLIPPTIPPTNNATGNVMYQLFNQLASCCNEQEEDATYIFSHLFLKRSMCIYGDWYCFIVATSASIVIHPVLLQIVSISFQ